MSYSIYLFFRHVTPWNYPPILNGYYSHESIIAAHNNIPGKQNNMHAWKKYKKTYKHPSSFYNMAHILNTSSLQRNTGASDSLTTCLTWKTHNKQNHNDNT